MFALGTRVPTRYTGYMVKAQRTVAGIVLIMATLCQGALAAPYGMVRPPRAYEYAFACALPYRCRDAIEVRIELERYRHMQALREQGTQPETNMNGASDGPWGRPRYLPAATPEANIQPAYRGKSQLLPQYEPAAQPSKQ